MGYKQRLAYILLVITILLLPGCYWNSSEKKTLDLEQWLEEEVTNEDVTESTILPKTGKKVGVAMPTRSSERWISDGINMKAKLEALGYEVDLQYAEDDILMQITQIESMIINGADCLVIASVDSQALVEVLELAKQEGVAVIAYDRLLMETDAVSYYASFDNKEVGKLIGTYIEEKMELKEARQKGISYTIEFFMGSPDDNNALFMYDGVMEVLRPYLEEQVLQCKSGKISFEETCILRWSRATAKDMCLEYLNQYYKEESLDIVCSVFDGFSYGVIDALQIEGDQLGINWPFITGQDAELPAIHNIIAGRQRMTVYKDTRVLASKCVTMVQAVLEGAVPEINDTSQYHNGKKSVPSYLCVPVTVDQENYKEVLVDGKYYTLVQLLE